MRHARALFILSLVGTGSGCALAALGNWPLCGGCGVLGFALGAVAFASSKGLLPRTARRLASVERDLQLAQVHVRELEIALKLAAAERQADFTREQEIAQLKNDFVAMVSHELRTPLASIRAYVEMLIDGEADNPKMQREFFGVIQSEANRLGRLIDDILSISRIESGLVSVDKKRESLSMLARDAIGLIQSQAAQKRISVIQDLAGPQYQTLCDREMLLQALSNLLANAVKYTPAGGSITVQVAVDHVREKVVARITDTGVGIPPKDIPFVFDKFFRAGAHQRMAAGTGLGLSLVKHIVETVHQGHVFLQSQVGKGSCFGFELDKEHLR